jgi:hypothetical protein
VTHSELIAALRDGMRRAGLTAAQTGAVEELAAKLIEDSARESRWPAVKIAPKGKRERAS